MIDDGLAKLKKLSTGNAEQSVDFSTSFTFMQRTLQERKDLSIKLEEAERDK